MISSELHRRALRPGLLLQCKACLSELWSSIQGGRGAATDPREVSGFQIIQLGLAVCPLLWRCVQEVAADVEGERQESAVQIHHDLLLILLQGQDLIARCPAADHLPTAVERGQAQPGGRTGKSLQPALFFQHKEFLPRSLGNIF